MFSKFTEKEIFVGNLHPDVTSALLRDKFSAIGGIRLV